MAKKKPSKPNAAYALPSYLPNGAKVLIALDPGSKNFGIAAVRLDKDVPKVLATAVMTTPVNDLVKFNKARADFLEEMARWVDTFQPVGFIAERFQTRGNGGPLIEMVSIMIGLVGGRYPHLPLKLTIASAWKNRVNRRFELDLKEDVYPTANLPPHQVDAALIGVYGFESAMGVDLNYTVQSIVTQARNTSAERIL